MYTCDSSHIFGELPDLSRKILSEIYQFYPNFLNLSDLHEQFSYIFYTVFINLPEMERKSPWSFFETQHM